MRRLHARRRSAGEKVRCDCLQSDLLEPDFITMMRRARAAQRGFDGYRRRQLFTMPMRAGCGLSSNDGDDGFACVLMLPRRLKP